MVLGLYWNLRARASAPTEEAHRIRCERFQVGDCWTWLYRDANGDPSSWERYTVSTARGSDLESSSPANSLPTKSSRRTTACA